VVLTLDMDNGTTHPARLAGGTKDVAITGGRFQNALIFFFGKKTLPWVGQTDIGLGVPTEANLAQEASVFQHERVVTLVEEVVGAMESLIGFVNILGMYMPTDVRDSQYSQKRTGHDAPRAAHVQP